jgi:hypothetical protein
MLSSVINGTTQKSRTPVGGFLEGIFGNDPLTNYHFFIPATPSNPSSNPTDLAPVSHGAPVSLQILAFVCALRRYLLSKSPFPGKNTIGFSCAKPIGLTFFTLW